jgi:hypothetical protein
VSIDFDRELLISNDICYDAFDVERKRWVEDSKTIRSNQVHALQQEIKELKAEKIRFEQLYEDMGRKYSTEQEV